MAKSWWYNYERDNGLEEWELSLKAELIRLWEQDKFLEMLTGYCHEDIYIAKTSGRGGAMPSNPKRDKKFCAVICSGTGYGDTPEEAIFDLASTVIDEIVEKNAFGC